MNEKKMDKQAFQKMCQILNSSPIFNMDKLKFSWYVAPDAHNGNPCLMFQSDNVFASFDEFVSAVSKHDKVLAEKLRVVGQAHAEVSQHIADRLR